jgi:hypothetical protein
MAVTTALELWRVGDKTKVEAHRQAKVWAVSLASHWHLSLALEPILETLSGGLEL